MGKKKASSRRKRTKSPLSGRSSGDAAVGIADGAIGYADTSGIDNLPSLGRKHKDIDVEITYKIISLFSEGLYSSPNKAIEELISNSFDAGALKVHLIIPTQLASQSSIVVIDNGEGMDDGGLRDHWLIGFSNKRSISRLPRGRHQIGQFGIGKLATYVLANRLTHVTKCKGKFFATTIDYREIDSRSIAKRKASNKSNTLEKKVSLPLRELSEAEAKSIVQPWIRGDGEAYTQLTLFGKGASPSWTVAIMSELKDSGLNIKHGHLPWILSTAMPARPDFSLYLNGDLVKSSKLKKKKVGKWIIGKDIKEVPTPASKDFSVSIDNKTDSKSVRKYGLTHRDLGRVSGIVEVYEDDLTTGKSSDIGRSHGFFVYVRERLFNVSDSGFGIPRNLLRHGTFSHIRIVVQIDNLDQVLRSSRETIKDSALVDTARNLLQGLFNFCRQELNRHLEKSDPTRRVSSRVASTPNALARTPIISLVRSCLAGSADSRFISIPKGLTSAQADDLVAALVKDAEDGSDIVKETRLEPIGTSSPIAILDIETRTIMINELHPFVAYFLDDYEDRKRNLPLELMATSEILLETHLYQVGIKDTDIDQILTRRDQLLRFLANQGGRRTALMVAQALLDAATDEDALEKEVVESFNMIGFEAVRLGKSNKPDGVATAHLSAIKGLSRRYAVSLEAKSKQSSSGIVSKDHVKVSTVTRHRDKHNCDHAIVIGPKFATKKKGDASSLIVEAQRARTAEYALAEKEDREPKTITLMEIDDLARLVKHFGRRSLDQLRPLFVDCTSPDESKKFIDTLLAKKPKRLPWKTILGMIWEEQQADPTDSITFDALKRMLRKDKSISMTTEELESACRGLRSMLTGGLDVIGDQVTLNQPPIKLLNQMKDVESVYAKQSVM